MHIDYMYLENQIENPMRRLKLLLLVFLIGQLSYAQSESTVDSLERLIDQKNIDPNQKDILLNKLWEVTIDVNTEYAKQTAGQIVENAIEMENDTLIALGLTRLGIAYSYMTLYDKSGVEYQKALRIYERFQDSLKIGYIYMNLGLDYSEQDIMDSTLYYYDRALVNFTAVRDTTYISRINRYVADTYGKKGYYELGLKKALDATRLLEKSGDSIEIVMSYFGIASFYHELKDSIAAENYLLKINSFFEEKGNPRWESTAKLRLAGLWLNNPYKYEEALAQVERGIELAKQLNFQINIADGLLTKGLLLFRMGRIEEAEKAAEEALTYSRPTNVSHSIARSLNLLAEIKVEQGDFDKSRSYLNEALDITKKAQLLTQQKEAYQVLAKVDELNNLPAQALVNYKAFKNLNDSIFQRERINKVEEWKIIFDTEKKEAALALQDEEIKTLNERAKVDKLTKGLYAGGMASALALSGLLVFGFRQRIKKNRIAREKQEEIYRKEIEHKKKELASQTLHLVQKNTFIQELMENLQNLRSSPEKFKMEFRRIVMLLKKENASDKDWEVFKTYFAEVHNDFDQKLKTFNSDISEKEIRLAAFLRMNLTTKEIAATMNVLPDSILKSKYRLKKKLGLDKATDLGTFLNTL